MSVAIDVKLKRSIEGRPDDYGSRFTKLLNDAVGGKHNWECDEWAHGIAATSDRKLRIRRCEDGPEFYLNVANTLAACGSFLVSAIALWLSVPKKEKELGGERHVELRSGDLRIRIDGRNSATSRKTIDKIVKALK